MADPMTVEVVSADAEVWSGEAEQVTARTVEGDIGILPGHEPVLAVLVPGVVSIAEPGAGRGDRVQIAVDGGFLSVAQDRVSILSEYARFASEISLADAEAELATAQAAASDSDDPEAQRQLQRAEARVKAAQTAGTR